MNYRFDFKEEPLAAEAYGRFDGDEEFDAESTPWEWESDPPDEPGALSFEWDDLEWQSEVNRRSRDYNRWIQRSLNQVLGTRLAVDGIIGTQTRSAIRRFQQQRGLAVDGIVGSQTERVLIAAGAESPPLSHTPPKPQAPSRPTPIVPVGRRCRFRFTPRPIEALGGGRIKERTPPRSDDLVEVRGIGGRRIRLHRLAAEAWNALISAARSDGISHPLFLPTSGFRDPEHQRRLWERALERYGSPQAARKWVAPPGSSPHQSGRAIDFYLGGKNSSGNVAHLRRLPAYKWLVENAACFGFYPYKAEPWHWEYNPPAGSESEIHPQLEELLEAFQDDTELLESDQREALEIETDQGLLRKVMASRHPLSEAIRETLRRGGESLAIRLAIQRGIRSENDLTNLVFFARHPERQGRKISRSEPGYERLAREWLDIRDRLVRPALAGVRAKIPPSPRLGGKPSASGVDQNVIHRIAQYDDLIDRVATEAGVDSNIVRGLIAAESGGRANLEARSGYKGLMQAGTKPDQLDPETSIRTGVQKFRMFCDRWLGPRLRNLGIDIRSLEREAVVRWVATAYNAGHRTVLKAVEYALAVGNANLWMQPEYFQRALLYTGAYSVRQAAPSCLQGRGDPQLVARALQENQRLRGQGITVKQARAVASPLLLCAVEFKHRNLPRYVNRIIAYMRYYDRIRPAQLREVVSL